MGGVGVSLDVTLRLFSQDDFLMQSDFILNLRGTDESFLFSYYPHCSPFSSCTLIKVQADLDAWNSEAGVTIFLTGKVEYFSQRLE